MGGMVMQNLPGLLGGVAGKASEMLDKNGGHGVLDHLVGASGQAADMARQLPGGEFLLDTAEKLWTSDVPGGFQVGSSLAVSLSTTPGLEGFELQSIPDGAGLFIGEESHCLHCLCCWMGRGPTYHVYKGNPMEGKEVLTMQSHRMCCCSSPEIDVMSPDGQEVAAVDEHGCLCCASTQVAVRDKERYKVSGHLFGSCCCCCSAASHAVRDQTGRRVGKIVHGSDFMHIDFPEDARASDKAGLLGAALLTELRSCGVICTSCNR